MAKEWDVQEEINRILNGSTQTQPKSDLNVAILRMAQLVASFHEKLVECGVDSELANHMAMMFLAKMLSVEPASNDGG